MTLLAAENITVTRGGRAILSDVSLQAHAGEFIAVLGPNGAGKSTLLKVLAGLLKPDAGRVMLDSKFLGSLSTRQLAQAARHRRLAAKLRARHQPRAGTVRSCTPA
jgi:ABC-type cobalamin/Fe3+-siderophores transport system ATPase subunit